ncbi:MAG: hypothetical protein IT159_00790 [Bryobacterales bacterium]|nr:hypothetical protein [Bryobacterales bacterium]
MRDTWLPLGTDTAATILAGLQTGVLAGLAVVAYYALGSLAAGEAAWAVPVRMATALFGRDLYRHSLTAAAAGLSLVVFSGGMGGLFFGLAMRHTWALRRVALLGPLAALSWYYVVFEVLLPRAGLGRYLAVAPRKSLVFSHLLFGLLLGLYPRIRRSLG